MTRPIHWLGIALFPLGCSAIPDSIPDKMGTFGSEQDVRRLWLPASPDNAVSPYFVLQTLRTINNTGCPTYEDSDDGGTYSANGCEDDDGHTWYGEAYVRESEEDTAIDMADFGVASGGVSWTMKGRLTATSLDGGNVELASGMAIDFSDEEDAFEAWQDMRVELDWNSGDYRLNEMNGEVGIEDWGLATIDIDGPIYLGRALTCDHPSGGALYASAENTLEIDFGDHTIAECNDCPLWSYDGGEEQELCAPLHNLTVTTEQEDDEDDEDDADEEDDE